jgi:hypothetical protein
MTTRITTTETIEDLGSRRDCGVEFEIEWELTPGEPMVRYYPDGSGYPGSPAMAEPIGVKITAAWGDGWFCIDRGSLPHWSTERYLKDHVNAPDWLRMLTDYVDYHVQTDKLDDYMYNALEAANEADEAAKDYVAEERYERLRMEE